MMSLLVDTNLTSKPNRSKLEPGAERHWDIMGKGPQRARFRQKELCVIILTENQDQWKLQSNPLGKVLMVRFLGATDQDGDIFCR